MTTDAQVDAWLNDERAVNNLLDRFGAPSAADCAAGWAWQAAQEER